MTTLTTLQELEAIYGDPSPASLAKEVAHIVEPYRKFIEASPFCTLATSGPEGLDCSPRGDQPGFVRVKDDNTLLMPDRKGNNRTDSLRNIIRDPRIALCFFVPGSGTTMRVNGEAHLSIDEQLKQSFAVTGKEPRSVIVIKVKAIYFQCARAIVRSGLWSEEAQKLSEDLPTPGEMLAHVSDNQVGGPNYDKEWTGRAMETLW